MAGIEVEYSGIDTAPEETDIFLGVSGEKPNPIVEIHPIVGAWLLSDEASHGPAPALIAGFEARRQNLARQKYAK